MVGVVDCLCKFEVDVCHASLELFGKLFLKERFGQTASMGTEVILARCKEAKKQRSKKKAKKQKQIVFDYFF